MQGQHGHLSTEQKQLAFRLRARGWRLVDMRGRSGAPRPWSGRWCATEGTGRQNISTGSRVRVASRSVSVSGSSLVSDGAIP